MPKKWGVAEMFGTPILRGNRMVSFHQILSALLASTFLGFGAASPVEAQNLCVHNCKHYMYGERVGSTQAENAGMCRDQCHANAACHAWMYWGPGTLLVNFCEFVGPRYLMDKYLASMNVVSGITRPR